MDLRMTVEWNEKSGIKALKMLDLLDKIQEFFNIKKYGSSVKEIWVVVIAREHDFKQRKRFKKDTGHFEYDILLDYFLIK